MTIPEHLTGEKKTLGYMYALANFQWFIGWLKEKVSKRVKRRHVHKSVMTAVKGRWKQLLLISKAPAK